MTNRLLAHTDDESSTCDILNRFSSRWGTAMLLLLGSMLTGCGPEADEVGRGVMLAAPLAVIVGTLVIRLFFWIERKRLPDLKMSWKRRTILT